MVELYLYSPYMPIRRLQGKLYTLITCFFVCYFLMCLRHSFFVYLAPFLAISYSSSLYLSFYLFLLSLHTSIFILFFLLVHSFSYLFGFPFCLLCLLFVAFYAWSFHLTTSQSVIILTGKKHAQYNLLPCLLIMIPGSSLEVYWCFRGT